jgi:small subunit ribosomal protein S13|tara:strand:- start:598 stop:1233 length:636 start_codon:yes stop_codon:yes gene_type:complete
MVFNGVTKNLAYLSTQYENLIRILGNDIPGERKILVGLTQIRGVGIMFANSIVTHLKIDPNSKIGNLNVEQVASIEKVIENPESANFPIWFLNRRKDAETGKDLHLVTSDIAFNVRNDIEREKSVFSWRGYRHMFGLKVRGQRTRCTGRKGGAVGVAKGGRIMPAKGGAGAPPAEGAAAPAEGDAAPAAAAEGAAAPAAEKKESPPAEKKV